MRWFWIACLMAAGMAVGCGGHVRVESKPITKDEFKAELDKASDPVICERDRAQDMVGELSAMSQELAALHNPKVDRIMRPHFGKVQTLLEKSRACAKGTK